MTTGTMPALIQTSPTASLVEMNCPECQQLETTRSGWVHKYMDLLRKRKLLLMDGKLPGRDLIASLAEAESELKQVWKHLMEHGASHSSVA